MKILFIAPLPPPITGHSLVSKVLLEDLQLNYDVSIVNMSKTSLTDGADSYKRFIEVFGILKSVFNKKKNANIIYITISESFAGNVKDLFIYLICYKKLSKLFIHLHGGSIRNFLWDHHPFLFWVNKFFLRKTGGIIISGNSHVSAFSDFIDSKKIHIIPNFAQDYLFSTNSDIEAKFENADPLRILFVGGLIEMKGYNELADAFFELDSSMQKKIRIDFAGKFESEEKGEIFINKIKEVPQIQYHGIIDNQLKKLLFAKAHVFCLPTSFFEGQPISILEAYASGCAVVTTPQSGILDIFQDNVNGYVIKERSAYDVKIVIEKLIRNRNSLKAIGLLNSRLASEKFRVEKYNLAIKKIFQ